VTAALVDGDLLVQEPDEPPSAVNALKALPDLPRVDVHVLPGIARAFADFWHASSKLMDGLVAWTGPYVDDPFWEVESRLGTTTFSDCYVGPLVDGEVPSRDQYYGTTREERESKFVYITPPTIQLRVATRLLIRERTVNLLARLNEGAPIATEAGAQLVAAMDADLAAQEKLLGDLRSYFCIFGPNSHRWVKDAWRTRQRWRAIMDWSNLRETPLFRQAQLADWDLVHPPLRITQEELLAEGLSPSQAVGCWRALRAFVDRGETPNERAALLAKSWEMVGGKPA
jgi:hypothetical protein